MPHIARLCRGIQPLGVALTAYVLGDIQKDFQIAGQVFPVPRVYFVEQGNGGNDDGMPLIRQKLAESGIGLCQRQTSGAIKTGRCGTQNSA